MKANVSHTKQTEIGMLPVNWQAVAIKSICKLINGRGFKPHEWSDRGLPIIRIQNLNGSDEFNYFNGSYNPKIEVNHGQLLFAWSGSRGTSFGPHVWNGSKAVLNYHTWKLDYDLNKIDKQFFLYALRRLTVEIEASAHGASALVHTQKGEMAQFQIPLPPLPEQQAIAKALGDVDGLIASLEALIAKKRDIKQGAMQELLSGHRRLPRFKGEWQKVQLGRLCEMKSGETITSKRITDAGNYLCYGGNGRRGYTATFTHDGEHLLIGRVGALCGNINRVSGKFFASEHAIVGTCTPIADVDFLSLKLSTMSLGKMSEASAQPVLTVGKLKVVEIDIAKEIEEQREIAAVLLSMDAEIAALEAKLAKTRDLKQGMMQVLLTGEVRLV